MHDTKYSYFKNELSAVHSIKDSLAPAAFKAALFLPSNLLTLISTDQSGGSMMWKSWTLSVAGSKKSAGMLEIDECTTLLSWQESYWSHSNLASVVILLPEFAQRTRRVHSISDCETNARRALCTSLNLTELASIGRQEQRQIKPGNSLTPFDATSVDLFRLHLSSY